MRNFKYLYRVNTSGTPIPGSNIKTSNNPKGAYWRRLIPQYTICCGDINISNESHNRNRFYVRLNDLNKPVTGTLRKYNSFPGKGFQEVIPTPCCPVIGVEIFASTTTLEVGQTVTFVTRLIYANGSKIITDLPFTSDNDGVVSISGNTGTAEGDGTAEIEVTYGSFTDTVQITVTA